MVACAVATQLAVVRDLDLMLTDSLGSLDLRGLLDLPVPLDL
jgi:hypothetical protein